MQNDSVPDLPLSGGYQNIATTMDVFPRYLFAYPAKNQDAKTITRVIFKNLTEHEYLATTNVSDKGSAFVSQAMKEAAHILALKLEHAATKCAQKIGKIGRAHASSEEALKIETSELRSMWHKYVNFAVLSYNTSYHICNGCKPSGVFSERVPYNVVDYRMGIRIKKQLFFFPRMPKTFLSKAKCFSKMYAKMECKPT